MRRKKAERITTSDFHRDFCRWHPELSIPDARVHDFEDDLIGGLGDDTS